MNKDALAWATGKKPFKRISKETLNHRGIIELISGLDVYQHTREAYLRAYQALGIDLINRVPLENAPPPTPVGSSRRHSSKPYDICALGVYDTVCRYEYPCRTPDDVWNMDMDLITCEDILAPVAHGYDGVDIQARTSVIGDIGLYYPLYYTTLFMWAVEVLGWEIFMLAAWEEPDRFHKHFLLPCVKKSRRIVAGIAAATDSPFVFVHDDLASSTGPMFPVSWYDDYILPHYGEIFEPARKLGKKIIFVADGNMTVFLEKLIKAGVDGLMFENPATPLDAVIECFGQSGRFFIGGMETVRLTVGTPAEVKKMVYDLAERAAEYQGFAISSCGGLHGNIPLANLEAYFDARADVGFTPTNWRTQCRA